MTERRAALAAGSLAALMVAAACASQTIWITPPIPVTPGPVNGLLLDANNRPLPDQIVAIGAEKTTSIAEGRFAFASVPVNYDLVIASPDGDLATVYQGLTRRDPIVVFSVSDREPAHKGSIAVTLAGAAAARESWQVHFVSARAFGSIPHDGWAAVGDKARNAEPLVVKWDGADSISGVVLAHAIRREKLSISQALFAQQAVTLRSGQALAIELRPANAPVVRRPSPVVQLPKEDPGFDPSYREEYRLPGAGFAMRAASPAQIPYDIPDLTRFGLQLCANGFQGNPYVRSDRVQCGVAPGQQTTVVLPSPPAFKSPAWDTQAAPGMSFTWTPVPGGVYRLVLSPQSEESEQHPSIAIVTARTEATWPDLSAVGVGFPKPLAAYVAVVGTHGPLTSMDDLVSPQGLADPVPRDRWRTDSRALSIPVEPPLGKEEAACVFTETVFCGPKPAEEYYRLSVINRKIRRYPEFAAAARLHCVRDCEGARTYLKVYSEYSEAHPGFDRNEPVNMAIEREPELSPEGFRGRRRAWSGGR